jgi:hypothetical protein
MTDLDPTDADRLELLDRLVERVPELDLSQRSVEWIEMPDGAQGLAVDGGGFDGDGNGFTFANAGEDVHAIGTLAPIFPGWIGCIVLKPDGTRVLTGVQPDPLAQQKPD